MRPITLIYFFYPDDLQKDFDRDIWTKFSDVNKEIRVIGVLYPITFFTLLGAPKRFWRYFFQRSFKVREGVSIFVPFGLLNLDVVNSHPILLKIQRFLLRVQIQRYLRQEGCSCHIVLWFRSLVAFPGIVDNIPADLLVYDCKDEILAYDSQRHIKEIEQRSLKRFDVVFSTSNRLHERNSRFNEHCYYLPNSADFDFFNQANLPQTQVHGDLKDIPGPVAGYLGNIRSWLDFDLLTFLVQECPDVSFVFVGPVEPNAAEAVEGLKKRKNVYFLGRKDRDELPGILKGFDLCLIPFKDNESNRAANPVKFWEYLATGKPILSLRIPSLEFAADYVELYATKEEALAKLEGLLDTTDEQKREQRLAIARANDIHLRLRQYYGILSTQLKAKGS